MTKNNGKTENSVTLISLNVAKCLAHTSLPLLLVLFLIDVVLSAVAPTITFNLKNIWMLCLLVTAATYPIPFFDRGNMSKSQHRLGVVISIGISVFLVYLIWPFAVRGISFINDTINILEAVLICAPARVFQVLHQKLYEFLN